MNKKAASISMLGKVILALATLLLLIVFLVDPFDWFNKTFDDQLQCTARNGQCKAACDNSIEFYASSLGCDKKDATKPVCCILQTTIS